MASTPFDHLHLNAYLYVEPGADIESKTLAPRFGYSFHFDTFDVRSSAKRSGQFTLSLPVVDIGPEASWPQEMFSIIERSRLRPLPEQELTFLPPSSVPDAESLKNMKDTALRSAQRYFRIRLFTNQVLGIYSHPDESREEFRTRCLEHARQEFQADLDEARLKYDRMLVTMVHRANRNVPGEENEDPITDRLLSTYKTLIQNAREVLARLFLSSREVSEEEMQLPKVLGDEIEEDFDSFFRQVRTEFHHLLGRIQARADRIEDYEFSLRHNELVLDEVFVIWSPA